MRRIDLRKDRAARVGTIRDINRQIVLNYVRDKGPISRAEIARETALQRSTVSIIIEALKDEGLVEELGAGESTGGRRPTLLRVRAMGMAAIGVDVGPVQTTIASSDLAGRLLVQQSFKTTWDSAKMIDNVVKGVRSVSREHVGGPIEGIGVSIPGIVDPASGRTSYVPYFEWRDWPIGPELGAASGMPVIVDNDANAAAMAELWLGRPEVGGVRNFIMVLVGEGIGTGIVFDGQVYRGDYGAAGEFGHMVVGTGSTVACSCGSHDCWEAFASDRATIGRYAKRARSAPVPGDLCISTLVGRALDGEAAAVQSLLETADHLGTGISNLIVGLSPEAVIVSGEITHAWSLIAPAIEARVSRSVRRGLPQARILASTLGRQPTLIGAISLVLARKFASAYAA